MKRSFNEVAAASAKFLAGSSRDVAGLADEQPAAADAPLAADAAAIAKTNKRRGVLPLESLAERLSERLFFGGRRDGMRLSSSWGKIFKQIGATDKEIELLLADKSKGGFANRIPYPGDRQGITRAPFSAFFHFYSEGGPGKKPYFRIVDDYVLPTLAQELATLKDAPKLDSLDIVLAKWEAEHVDEVPVKTDAINRHVAKFAEMIAAADTWAAAAHPPADDAEVIVKAWLARTSGTQDRARAYLLLLLQNGRGTAPSAAAVVAAAEARGGAAGGGGGGGGGDDGDGDGDDDGDGDGGSGDGGDDGDGGGGDGRDDDDDDDDENDDDDDDDADDDDDDDDDDGWDPHEFDHLDWLRRLQESPARLHGKVLHALGKGCTLEINKALIRLARRFQRMGQREGAKGLRSMLREHFYQHFAAQHKERYAGMSPDERHKHCNELFLLLAEYDELMQPLRDAAEFLSKELGYEVLPSEVEFIYFGFMLREGLLDELAALLAACAFGAAKGDHLKYRHSMRAAGGSNIPLQMREVQEAAADIEAGFAELLARQQASCEPERFDMLFGQGLFETEAAKRGDFSNQMYCMIAENLTFSMKDLSADTQARGLPYLAHTPLGWAFAEFHRRTGHLVKPYCYDAESPLVGSNEQWSREHNRELCKALRDLLEKGHTVAWGYAIAIRFKDGRWRGLERATKILNDAERCGPFLGKYRVDDRTRCSSPPTLPSASAPAPAGGHPDAARYLPPPPLPSPAPLAVAGKAAPRTRLTHNARLSLHQRH